MMEPQVTKRDRKLHLLYRLRHRVHCSAIYPVSAPNGSTVIIYGHENGLRIFWRGGARRKRRAQTGVQANSTNHHEIMIIDGQDEEDTADGSHDYDYEDDELDPDCPYPSISDAVDVELDTGVLHLGVPSSDGLPLPRSHAIIAVALTDGSQRLLSIPLAPADDLTNEDFAQNVRESQMFLPRGRGICRAIALKVLASADGKKDEPDFVLVAGTSDVLSISRVSCSRLPFDPNESALESQSFALSATRVSFAPSSKSTLLLVVLAPGSVHILDALPRASHVAADRPSSSDSTIGSSTTTNNAGQLLMACQSSFVQAKPGRARRKLILDASWLMNGKAIMVLSEDGEWGIWEVAGASQSNKSTADFALNGFLGAAGVSESSESSTSQRVVARLAPMTPSTRRTKAENLFAGSPKVSSVPLKGGISVSLNNTRAGQTDESVVMWYGGDIYSITSSQTFWQRSTAPTGRGTGSLYSPTLTHMDINLMGETITSISQFGSTSSSNNLGQMNHQRDLLISAEHHITVVQSSRPPVPAKSLFQQSPAERPTLRDQRRLDVGDLDLGGMDRLLDNMANDDIRPRRVGFAH